MANLQTLKLLCVTMLLLGLCINQKVKISFDVNIGKNNEHRVAFKKMLIEGLLEYAQNNVLKDADLKNIFDFLTDDCIKDFYFESLFEDHMNWNVSGRDILNKHLPTVSTRLNEIKTKPLSLNVRLEIHEYDGNNQDKIDTKEKQLELKSIAFSPIRFKQKLGVLVYNHYSSREMSVISFYQALMNGFTFEDSFTLVEKSLNYLLDLYSNNGSFSLNIASLNDIKVVLNKPEINQQILL